MLQPKSYYVKICGITNLKDAEAACMLGASAIGFVAYPKSKRYISPLHVKKITLEISSCYPDVELTGVFVDEDINILTEYINAGINVIQLHGTETPYYVQKLKEKCSIEIWRAIRLKQKSDIISLSNYNVDKFLIDSFVKGETGGTGVVCDWDLAGFAVKYLKRPVILAGGLSSNNILDAIEKVKPYGVDVSSGVEIKPGLKDCSMIKTLMEKIKGKE